MGFEPKEPRARAILSHTQAERGDRGLFDNDRRAGRGKDAHVSKDRKGMRNAVNRKVKCDTANVTKTVDAALSQLDAINRLDAAVGITSLPDKLRRRRSSV
jgi:hypothetical protein